MNIKKSIKNNIEKMALCIDKLDDNYDKKYLRVNNINLVLFPKNDGYLLAVVATPKTKRWIATNMGIKCKTEDFGKVVYSLDGTPYNIEARVEDPKHFKTPTYFYQGKEVAPLFDFSNNSKRLFWTSPKLKALDKLGENDKLSIIDLIFLQDNIDDELAQKNKQKQDEHSESEELTF